MARGLDELDEEKKMNHKLNRYNKVRHKVEENEIIIDLNKVITLELLK